MSNIPTWELPQALDPYLLHHTVNGFMVEGVINYRFYATYTNIAGGDVFNHHIYISADNFVYLNEFDIKGTVTLRDGVWENDGVIAIHPAKPTMAQWQHKIDGTHTYDNHMWRLINEGINLHWSPKLQASIERECIEKMLEANQQEIHDANRTLRDLTEWRNMLVQVQKEQQSNRKA